MATPATARRSDLHAGKFEAEHTPPRSPLIAQRSRDSTPRPSISPLSTASYTIKPIPDLPLDEAVDEKNVDLPGLRDQNASATHDYDDRSSSLSDIGDEEDDLETEEQLKTAMARSRPRSVTPVAEDDSEAETERLDQTPWKRRKLAEVNGRTPSKLSQAAAAEDELSDPPSPLPVDHGAASSTNTVTTAGVKRKRSETGSSSLTSQDEDDEALPRKRSHSSKVHAQIQNELETDIIDDNEEAILDEGSPLSGGSHENALNATGKTTTGRKGKQRGRNPKDFEEHGPKDETDEVDQEQEQAHLSVEASEEQSDESGAKNEEDMKNRSEALALFTEVASQFVAFKEKMYNERLESINAELQMLAVPDCTHPEYLRQIACVDARFEKQVREAQAYYNYKLKAIKQRTIGERSQLHSQYFQTVRELRDEAMTALGEDWYNIQKERRDTYQEKDQWLYRFPTKRSTQIKNQAKYNQEVSVLSGFAKYVGFPAAPDVQGLSDSRADEDMRSMRIPKRPPHPTTNTQQFNPYNLKPAFPTPPTNERLAHEQYLEQNAWARPQGPIHALATPNFTHTPDWAEPTSTGPAKHIMRNLSGVRRAKSPFTTPVPPRRQNIDPSSTGTITMANNSDVAAEPLSSALPPHTSGRLDGSQLYGPFSSPLNVPKHRTNMHDSTGTNGERELTGFRNVSNISSISNASTVDAPITLGAEDVSIKQPQGPGTGGHDWAERDKNLNSQYERVQQATTWQPDPSQQPFFTSALHRLSDSGRLLQQHDGQSHSKRPFAGPPPPPQQLPQGLAASSASSSPPRPQDGYPQLGFRPHEGPYGTPAPLASAQPQAPPNGAGSSSSTSSKTLTSGPAPKNRVS